MNLNKYVIQSDAGSYFKGHGKRGAVFTNNPEDALVFDDGEDAGQLAYLMNYTLSHISDRRGVYVSGSFSEVRLDHAINSLKGVR